MGQARVVAKKMWQLGTVPTHTNWETKADPVPDWLPELDVVALTEWASQVQRPIFKGHRPHLPTLPSGVRGHLRLLLFTPSLLAYLFF